jgi:hypothetical protein
MMARTSLSLAMIVLLSACGSNHTSDAPETTATTTPAAPLATVRSASITLPPDEETFGEGTDADLLNRSCLACHSVTMVRYQPPLNEKQWTATVTKMREAYGAPFAKSDTAAIVAALMRQHPPAP